MTTSGGNICLQLAMSDHTLKATKTPILSFHSIQYGRRMLNY